MKKLVDKPKWNVNEEGYLTDFNEWNKKQGELGRRTRYQINREATGSHCLILQGHQPFPLGESSKSGVIDIKEFYALFRRSFKMSTLLQGSLNPKKLYLTDDPCLIH